MKLTLFFGILLLCVTSSQSYLLFNDQFVQSMPFEPSDIDSSYGYFFFDATQTNINNLLSGSTLHQSVNPFTWTLPQGPTGALDHVKVLQYHTQQFKPGLNKGILKYKFRGSAQSYNVLDHPFPSNLVSKPNDDLRLGSCAVNTVDFDTMMVADFFLTNEGLYAFYERLPFARTPTNNYRSFSQAKRVSDRTAQEKHNLRIEYDINQRTLSWFVEQTRVLFVTLIGYPSNDPKVRMMIDHGGENTLVQPTGFRAGWGCFTLLDALDYHNTTSTKGLVRLNSEDGPDYNRPLSFHDDESLLSNRLWGQGAEIEVDSFRLENF